MRVTIVGHRGFLGKALAARLHQRGWEVDGCSSSTPGNIDPATGLLSPQFTIRPATDAVVYLAQSPYFRQMPERADHLWNVNVVSAVQTARLAARAGVLHFVYASTGSVYAPSFKPLAERSSLRRDRWYPLSKIHAEESLALLRSEIAVTCVRPFGIYGPGQSGMLVSNLIESVHGGKSVTIDRHPQEANRDGLKISLCYVDDAAQSIERLLEIADPPSTMNLAGSEAVSIRHIASGIGKLLDIEPKLQEVDRQRETDLIADLSCMTRTVGVPPTSFATGIEMTIEAWLASRERPLAAAA